MKVIIFLKGGLVQSVYSEDPHTQVHIVDYDVQENIRNEQELDLWMTHVKNMEMLKKRLHEVL